MANPVPAVGSIWQHRVEYLCNGQRLLNTFNYRQTVAILDYEVTAASAHTWETQANGFQAKLLACLSSNVLLTTSTWQCLRPVRFRAVKFVVNTSGDQDENFVPQNVATVISRTGFLAGRKGQGAVHLPPPSGTNLANGLITNAQRTLMQAFAVKMLEFVIDEGGAAVLRPVLIGRPATSTAIDITDTFPQDTTRVMRRRTVGVGK